MLADAVRRDHLFTLESIDWGFIRPKRPNDRQMAYAQSEWMVEYVVERFGYDAIQNMIKLYREANAARTLRELFKLETTEFDRDFAGWASAGATLVAVRLRRRHRELALRVDQRCRHLRRESSKKPGLRRSRQAQDPVRGAEAVMLGRAMKTGDTAAAVRGPTLPSNPAKPGKQPPRAMERSARRSRTSPPTRFRSCNACVRWTRRVGVVWPPSISTGAKMTKPCPSSSNSPESNKAIPPSRAKMPISSFAAATSARPSTGITRPFSSIRSAPTSTMPWATRACEATTTERRFVNTRCDEARSDKPSYFESAALAAFSSATATSPNATPTVPSNQPGLDHRFALRFSFLAAPRSGQSPVEWCVATSVAFDSIWPETRLRINLDRSYGPSVPNRPRPRSGR